MNKDLSTQNYTSNLNSLSISPLEIIITTRKIIGNQKRKILTSMGFSIAELEESCVSLSSVHV